MQGLLSKCIKTLYQSPTATASCPFRLPHTICEPIPSNIHYLRYPVAQTYCRPFSLLGRSHIGPWRPNDLVQKSLRRFLSGNGLGRPFVAGAHRNGLLMKGHGGSFSRVGFWKSQFRNLSYRIGGNPFQSYGRRRRFFPEGFTTDGVVLGLILSNVAVFLLWRVADRDFMMKNFTISVENFRNGRVHTLITSAFSQIDVSHIVSNMIGLYFFGTSIGRYFGPEYLLKLYFTGAAVGSIFYLMYHAFQSQLLKERRMFGVDPSRVPGLGASGAVNAIMLLNIFLFPKATIFVEFIIPVPAILFGIFLIGNDVRRILEGDPHISGSAHLGGAAVAAYAWLKLRKGGRF